MDDLTLDTNLPIAANLAKRVVPFSDNVRRLCVNANHERATLDDFDGANLVMCVPRERSFHRVEVRVGQLRWPRNAREQSLASSRVSSNSCP